jgi:hypothetical protein
MADITALDFSSGWHSVNLLRIAARVAFPRIFRLAAFIVAGENAMMGRAIREHLESLYDGKLSLTDDQIGDKAMKVQRYNNADDKEDVVQDMMRYLHESGWKSDHSKTIDDAFGQLLSNLRVRGQGKAVSELKKRKKEVPLEDMWRDERQNVLKTDPKNDEKVDVLDFIKELEEELPFLVETLTADEKALFDVVFNDDNGTFKPDISQNMNQSAALKEKYPDLYKRNAKRWSGFVGDLRKKLFSKVEKFMTEKTSPGMFDSMADLAG